MLETVNLLGEDFSMTPNEETANPSNSKLLDLTWPSTSDFLGGDFMPSKLLQEGNLNFDLADLAGDALGKESSLDEPLKKSHNDQKGGAQMSWLSLFAELDPLANQDQGVNAGDRA